MITLKQHTDTIEKSYAVYNKIDGKRYPAWKVIVGFYTALQIIDADLFKMKVKRPKIHGKFWPPKSNEHVKEEWRNHLVWAFYSLDIYKKYISFLKLSQKARYRPEYWHPVKSDPIPKVEKWLNEVFLPIKANL